MRTVKALLWEVDGALAETERDGHRVAFNQAFAELGLPWHWSPEHYADLLSIADDRERLLRDMCGRHDAPTHASARDLLARRLAARQQACCAELLTAHPPALRGGVSALMDDCLARGVQMAIATTSSRAVVAALLAHHRGTDWSREFAAVVCAPELRGRAPDPACHVQALLALRLAPREVVAIVGAPAAGLAARALDMPVVLARSACLPRSALPEAIAAGPGLDTRRGWLPSLDRCAGSVGRVELADIEAWASRAEARARALHRVA